MSAERRDVPVLMPKIGQVMEAGTIVRWLRRDGDPVSAGEVIAEVETDKATYELEAPAAGVFHTRVAEGEEVPVDTLIAVVNAEGGAAVPQPPAPARDGGGDETPTAPAIPRSGRVLASPKARRLAVELGVDLGTVVASAADGVISAEDVEAAAATPPAVPAVPGDAGGHGRGVRGRRPLSGIRRASALRLAESWRSIPHIVQMIDVDAGGLLAERERLGASGTRVSLNDLLMHTAARVLAAHPDLNVAIEDNEIVPFEGIDAGLAVDTPRGLVVAVVRGADRASVEELAAESARLVESARGAGLRAADVGGASFTVSNLGAWGIRAGTPVINLGEPLVIFAGAIEDRPVAETGHVVIRPMLTLSIAFDHRVADGVAAARFTSDLKQALEALGSAALPGRGEAKLGPREAALSSPAMAYESRVRSARFAWTLDEPEASGGSDRGPTPVEAFLGALASCLVITLKAVARRREVAFERVEAWAAANEKGHIERVTVELDVWTDQEPERMEEFLVRAKRGCYVSGVLKPEIDFEVELRVHPVS